MGILLLTLTLVPPQPALPKHHHVIIAALLYLLPTHRVLHCLLVAYIRRLPGKMLTWLTLSPILLDTDEYANEEHHHHHQAPTDAPGDVRQTQVFPGYAGNYPPNPSVGGASMAPSIHDASRPHHQSHPISARSKEEEEDRLSLFGDIPEAKKRKFILVDDPGKGGRVRVRVTLDTVDIKEIPDSFRKSNSVYPRSWFPMQMQSPPPSAHGSKFFEGDDADDDDIAAGGRPRRGRTMVSVPLADGGEAEVACPRMRKSVRSKEVKLNDLGYRMTWHQSRVFADKTVFLQKACKFYFPFSASHA